MKQETNENSAFETFLYTLIGVVVFIGALIMFLVSVLGEWVILAIGLFVAIGIGWFVVWAMSGWLTWLWAKIGDKREDWADRRLNREVLAATTRTQLLLAEKSSALVYAQDGFLPVAYASVMEQGNNGRLLELADKRIDTLRLPENVPNHLHIVTQSDTEQTLNNGANVPSVGGALGDLSFLLPGTQATKYKVLDTKDGDRDDEQQ